MCADIFNLLEWEGYTVIRSKLLSSLVSVDDVECLEFIIGRVRTYFDEVQVFLFVDGYEDVIVDVECDLLDNWSVSEYMSLIYDDVHAKYPDCGVFLMSGYKKYCRAADIMIHNENT